MRSFLLSSGRRIAFREYGDPQGYTVVLAHGNLNSSQFNPCWDKTQDKTKAIRLIAVDRPGYGDSSFMKDRSYIDWAKDINELTTLLSIDKFVVAGYSSGGPHALSCVLDERLIGPSKALGACVISGDGPYAEQEGTLQRMYGLQQGFSLEDAVERTKIVYHEMKAGYEAITDNTKRTMALADIEHAVKQGFQGAAQDSVLESRFWGFSLKSISKPVRFWHGSEDTDVPVDISSQYIFERLNFNVKNNLTIIPDENHSLIRRHWTAILEDITQTFFKSSSL